MCHYRKKSTGVVNLQTAYQFVKAHPNPNRVWAIALKSNSQRIGRAGIFDCEVVGDAETGYLLAKTHWDKDAQPKAPVNEFGLDAKNWGIKI